MAMFSAEPRTYQNACNLIKALKQAGIEANITAGGIRVYPEPQQVEQASSICVEFGCQMKAGYTAHQEDVLIRGGCMEQVANVTLNAQSVREEWV